MTNNLGSVGERDVIFEREGEPGRAVILEVPTPADLKPPTMNEATLLRYQLWLALAERLKWNTATIASVSSVDRSTVTRGIAAARRLKSQIHELGQFLA